METVNEEKVKPNCYECKHRGNVPGDAHSCCEYPGNDTGLFSFFSEENLKNKIKLNVKGHPQGVRMGWFLWPVNFDPTWLISCNGFENKL
jgi:hypothetical protein